MTRKKAKPKEKIMLGTMARSSKEIEEFAERLIKVPVTEYLESMGKSGSITSTDFFTDRLVDKLIQESIDDLGVDQDMEGE